MTMTEVDIEHTEVCKNAPLVGADNVNKTMVLLTSIKTISIKQNLIMKSRNKRHI